MTQKSDKLALLGPLDHFAPRHLGPRPEELPQMLAALDVASLDALIDQVVPAAIRSREPLNLPPAASESEALAELAELAAANQVLRSFIGMGYANCLVPAVIQRNVLENPGWYTQYTPYQAEIAQGRLQALLNFQTLVADLTGLPMANASLLDEATAAAEAMTLCLRAMPRGHEADVFFVSGRCHPQTIDVVRTRAAQIGVEVIVGDHESYDFARPTFGVLVQYPNTDGQILDYGPFFDQAHAHGALAVCAADLLALAVLRPPADFGADVAVGNSQRFGVPLGYGGPHAAFMATRDEYQRQLPGRLVGVSLDAAGAPALRLALQTREQHIRRDKATSNICTAQVLLAVMASLYAVYHGPDGLRRIAQRAHLLAECLAAGLAELGYALPAGPRFDSLTARGGPRSQAEI
ncbi:MAG: aminomethyl-transferring glycine dehydrogenase, partial [Candidatus Promineifilaceae bacterium]